MPGPAQFKYILLSILFVIATVNFTKTTLQILNSSKRLDILETEVSDLEIKKTRLKNDLEYKKSDEYIEDSARNQLGLVKPGEKLFIFPSVLGASQNGDDIKNLQSRGRSNVELWFDAIFLKQKTF